MSYVTPPPPLLLLLLLLLLQVAAADCDVNVISWNRLVGYMLASGADDGGLRVWDLRAFKEGGFVSQFNTHRWG
jgi:ribosome assembly protein RRB1